LTFIAATAFIIIIIITITHPALFAVSGRLNRGRFNVPLPTAY
jgi:hypothetical protein